MFRNKILRIESSDKDDSASSNSNFRVSLSSIVDLKNVKKIELSTVIFPNIFYNVRTGYDDVILLTENGQAQMTITVPEGWYSITQLMAKLKVLIDAQLVAGSVAVTQDENSKLITFTFTGTTASVDNLDALSTLSPNLGFITNGATGASYTGTVMPNLGGLNDIYIMSSALGRSNLMESTTNKLGKNRDCVGIIPITAPFGGSNVWESQNDLNTITYYGEERSLSEIDIRLENADGDLIDLQNFEIKLIFKIHYDQLR